MRQRKYESRQHIHLRVRPQRNLGRKRVESSISLAEGCFLSETFITIVPFFQFPGKVEVRKRNGPMPGVETSETLMLLVGGDYAMRAPFRPKNQRQAGVAQVVLNTFVPHKCNIPTFLCTSPSSKPWACFGTFRDFLHAGELDIDDGAGN